MSTLPQTFMNWSGGKDSALALHTVLAAGQFEVVGLLTTINEAYGRVSMHGVREELLDAQAHALGLPLTKIYLPEQVSMAEYDAIMHKHLAPLTANGITHAIFGDIFLEDLRRYREEKLAAVGLTGVFPLWQIPTAELARQFCELGFRGITVCVNEKVLDGRYVGQEMDAAFFASLPSEVDVCGENGEYHSFVYAGPLFSQPIHCRVGEKVRRHLGPANDTFDTAFWFADLLPG